MTLEPASEEDIPLIQELSKEIWHAHYPGILTEEQIIYMLDLMYGREAIEREMRSGVVYEIILLGHRAVGYLSYSPEPAEGRTKLDKLYVLPEMHGKGVGFKALNHVKAVARLAGTREVFLYVNKRNDKAIRAYRRYGFRISRSVATDIGGGFVMDDFLMTCSLPDGE